MRTLLNAWYATPKDIKVIPVHGKENVDVYADLLNAFHIPFSVMLDADSLHNSTIKLIQRATSASNDQAMRNDLKQHNIYILPHSLEQQYPRQFVNPDFPKPLRALKVAEQMAQHKEMLETPALAPIKEILDSITV
jgi:hypothetical protein